MRRRIPFGNTVLLGALALALSACDGSPDTAAVPAPSGADPGAAKATAATQAREATTNAADAGQTSVGSPTAPPPQTMFAEPGAGLRIAPVAGMQVQQDFRRDYLAASTWKLFAEPDSTGTPLVALVLDGSNKLTAAELRIGTSTDPTALEKCIEPPAEATGPASAASVGGQPFTHFSVGDAAMSHYVSAESYRAVREGKCYAIDLVIAGTRPEVYDPPRTPPFSNEEARKQLATALEAVHWVQ